MRKINDKKARELYGGFPWDLIVKAGFECGLAVGKAIKNVLKK